jgi:hypothetical protein
MGTAIVGVVGSLLGVVLGFLGQSLRARQERKLAIVNAKREVYAEFLRSISASYAEAKSDAELTSQRRSLLRPTNQRQASHYNDGPEDAKLLAATASIELLANLAIHKKARELSNQVREAHKKIRANDPNAEKDVSRVDQERYKLIEDFKRDLGIPLGDEQLSSRVPTMGSSDPL